MEQIFIIHSGMEKYMSWMNVEHIITCLEAYPNTHYKEQEWTTQTSPFLKYSFCISEQNRVFLISSHLYRGNDHLLITVEKNICALTN